jgi:hypothetical protein
MAAPAARSPPLLPSIRKSLTVGLQHQALESMWRINLNHNLGLPSLDRALRLRSHPRLLSLPATALNGSFPRPQSTGADSIDGAYLWHQKFLYCHHPLSNRIHVTGFD